MLIACFYSYFSPKMLSNHDALSTKQHYEMSKHMVRIVHPSSYEIRRTAIRKCQKHMIRFSFQRDAKNLEANSVLGCRGLMFRPSKHMIHIFPSIRLLNSEDSTRKRMNKWFLLPTKDPGKSWKRTRTGMPRSSWYKITNYSGHWQSDQKTTTAHGRKKNTTLKLTSDHLTCSSTSMHDGEIIQTTLFSSNNLETETTYGQPNWTGEPNLVPFVLSISPESQYFQ